MSTNLLSNPRFDCDRDGDGLADGWRFVGSHPDWASVRIEAGPRGGHIQTVQIVSPKAERRACHFGLASDGFALAGTGHLALRAWVKARNVSSFHLLLSFSDAEGRSLGSPIIPSPVIDPPEAGAWSWEQARDGVPFGWKSGSWDWQEWAVVLAPPEGATAAAVNFWFSRTGTLSVRDVYVGRVGGDRR